MEDGCRLVGIFGIGGVGKTAFAAKLVREIAQEFDYLIWRSLRNAPNIESMLIDIIGFLSHQQETKLNLLKQSQVKYIDQTAFSSRDGL